MKYKAPILLLWIIIQTACSSSPTGTSTFTAAPTLPPSLPLSATLAASNTLAASPVSSDTPEPPTTILPPTDTFVPPTATLPLTATPQPSLTLLPTFGVGSLMLARSDLRPMVFVPGGRFLMGAPDSDPYADPDEKPQHEVELDAFWVDQYEVTHTDYAACVQAGECSPPTELDRNGFSYQFASEIEDAPVVNVTWNDAGSYCAWAGKRLPTEAEWEKAARGEDARIYPWGNDPDVSEKAWFCNLCIFDIDHPAVRDDFSRPAPIWSFPEGASPYGAMHMAGNVWEWVLDWYAKDTYSQPSRTNPTGPETGAYRLVRGGSWTTQSTYLRTAYRQARGPLTTWIDVGFRCVMEDDRTKLLLEGESTQIPVEEKTLTPALSSTIAPTPASVAFSRLNNGVKVLDLAWSPDGSILASGSSDGAVILWDPATGERLRTLQGHTKYVPDLAWSPDGDALASGSGDGSIIFWDVETGEQLQKLSMFRRSVDSVAWSPDGSTLASGSFVDVALWDVTTGERLRTLEEYPTSLRNVAWSPDGSLLAGAKGDWSEIIITLWDAVTGRQLRTMSRHMSFVTSVYELAWSPDGDLLATGSSSYSPILWESATGQLHSILQGHEGRAVSVTWSPVGGLVASGSNDKTVILWDVVTGERLYTLEGHDAPVRCVAWSPDGSLLASGSENGAIVLWNMTQVLP